VKSDIEAKVAEVRSAAQGEDLEKIKSATEALGQAIQKIGASVYEQNQAPGGGEAGSSSSGSSGEAGPDVIDGEVKE
jgi:molecular chaperone DnaK